MKQLVAATALTLLLQPAQALEGPLAATTQGASCKPSTATAGKLNCYYKLPDGTSFDIEWVGDGPQIQIMRADRSGDYAVSFDTRSLCIMVSYGGRGHATLMKIQGTQQSRLRTGSTSWPLFHREPAVSTSTATSAEKGKTKRNDC